MHLSSNSHVRTLPFSFSSTGTSVSFASIGTFLSSAISFSQNFLKSPGHACEALMFPTSYIAPPSAFERPSAAVTSTQPERDGTLTLSLPSPFSSSITCTVFFWRSPGDSIVTSTIAPAAGLPSFVALKTNSGFSPFA